jgi:hypothetical protein
MDQIKTFLAVAKKHHFWILCGLACIVALGMFASASGSLSKAYDKKKTEITGVDQKLGTHIGNADHPNDNWVKAVQAKTESYRKRVYDAWGKLYAQQKTNVLIWPSDLGKEFVDAFNVDPAPVSANKMAELSELYQNYVTTTTLPAMAKIINAEWTIHGDKEQPGRGQFPAGPRGRGPAAPRADDAPQVEYPVVWDSSDQQRMYDTYTWDNPPRELEIRYAQEDMWVLKAIFDSIARANNGARIPNDAVVRTIQTAMIGYDAAEKLPLGEGANRIDRAPAAASTAAPLGMSGPVTTDQSAPAIINPRRPARGPRGPADSSGPGSHGRRGGFAAAPVPTDASGAADPDAALKNGRYVDAKGKPLAAADLATSTTPEYRLMAFHLMLVCDEARFQAVIAELANSVMPLEVREVRINPPGDSVSDRASKGRRDRSGPAFAAGGGGSDAGTVMHNATIEIHGLAYLINPPDPKKIWSGEVPAGIAAANGATNGAPTTGATGTATTGTAATGTATADNGSTTAPATPAATTGAADAAAAPTSNDKSRTAPAADASADKGAAATPRDAGATPKADAAAPDTATPPTK